MGPGFFDPAATLQQKNPALWSRLGWWERRLVERALNALVCRNRLHRLERGLGHLRGSAFAAAVLDRLRITLVVRGRDRLRGTGALTLCATHPTGILDGLLLLVLAGQLGAEGRIAVNDGLAGLTALADNLVPVDRFGAMAGAGSTLGRRSYQAVVGMFADRRPVLVFPAGRTARLRAGKMVEFAWDKGFVKLSRRFDRRVVPVTIKARTSALFNTLWRLRRLFGIGINVEMTLLVREFLRQRGRTIEVIIGGPQDLGPRAGIGATSGIGPGRGDDRHNSDRAIARRLRLEAQNAGVDR